MEVKDYICNICDTKGNWENVDKLAQHKKTGMHICLKCGHVGYPLLYKNEEEIREYYRTDYRPPPTINNLFSGQRKIHYHAYFLKDILEGWDKDKNNKPVVGEVGAAFGMVLRWFKELFPDSELYGSEMTLSYRRVSWHQHQIKLDEDLDYTKKYDLLMSYKVHEHLQNPGKVLRQMVLALKPTGYIYISVPCWFGSFYNFGASGADLNYYYSTNHIQVWTKTLFETLLRKCGLEIIKQDHKIYDSTYLCKRNDDMIDEKPIWEDPEDIKGRMVKIKAASILFDNRKFKEALDIWPEYPNCWQAVYENSRAEFHKKGFDYIDKEFIKPMLKACPNSSAAVGIAADICMRYNDWNRALDFLDIVLKMKPESPEALDRMSHCFRNLANVKGNNKIEMIERAKGVMKHLQQVSIQSRDQSYNWQYRDASQLPMPWEQTTGAK